MRSRFHLLAIWVTLGTSLSTPAQAFLHASAIASAGGAIYNGASVVDNPIQFSWEAISTTNDPFSRATASATYGLALANVIRWGAAYPTGQAEAFWGDNIHVDAPSYNGQMGVITASIFVGTTAYSSAATHVWHVLTACSVCTPPVLSGVVYGNQIPGLITFDVPFIFGETIGLEAGVRELYNSASGVDVDGGSAALAWQGIQSIELIDGTAIDLGAVSIYSNSGTDYLNAVPVPEAETYALMLSGLGLLGLVVRRRRQLAA